MTKDHALQARAEQVAVTGGFARSLADFERSCLVHIGEEQRRPNPDNALIALLCDAVRLTRERGALAGIEAAPVAQWRDIETAPTDGSWVLLYGPNLLHGVQYVTARRQRPDEGGIPWWKVDDGKFGPYDLRGPAPDTLDADFGNCYKRRRTLMCRLLSPRRRTSDTWLSCWTRWRRKLTTRFAASR